MQIVGRTRLADVAKPVDATDLKSVSFGSAGSTPAVRTRRLVRARPSAYKAFTAAALSGADEETPVVKFTILLRRKPQMSHADFVEHHKTVHAPLLMSIPAVKAHVRRYVQQHALPVELPGLPPAKYDGITELWFDEVAGIAAVFGNAEYMERIRPDEERFLDLHGCDFIVSEETAIAG